MQHPLAVAPPEATTGVVVIVGLIREAVVVPVQADPLDRAALAGQGAHDHEHTLQPDGHHQAAVGH